MSGEMITIDGVEYTKEDYEEANELIGDDKIDKLLNTIEDKGLEASEDAESDDLFIIADEDSAMIMTKDRE